MATNIAKPPAWLPYAEEHNFPAAKSHLRLIYADGTAKRLVVGSGPHQ